MKWFNRLKRFVKDLFTEEKPKPIEHFPQVKSFAYQYNQTFKPRERDYQFLDLWNYTEHDIGIAKKYSFHQIAYFSAHFEDWRSDAKDFNSKWLLKPLDDWKGEMIVDPVYIDHVLPIMEKRVVLAKKKGFTGVEFDNSDAFYYFVDRNLRGKAIEYYNKLFQIAKKHGMKCGLKNSSFMFPDVEPDFIICEQAFQYNEIDDYLQFGVPVFNIEYKRRHFQKAVMDQRVYSIMKDKYKMGAEEL